MRQVPKAPTIPLDENIDTLIGKMYTDWPLTEKMVTADQALQLILRK